jgi:AraC-like DNA-binding protein
MTRNVEYREFPAPESLRRHVRCLWYLKLGAAPERVDTVYPDGCCEIVAHRLAPLHRLDEDGCWRPQARSLFVAQQRSAIRLSAHGDAECLGVRLQPAAYAVFPNTSVADLRDRVVDLRELDADFAEWFYAAASKTDVEAAVAAVFELIGVRMPPIDERIEKAIDLLESTDGTLPIADLMSMCGMSERAFQAAFKSHVGLSAKEFARIRRLQATIRMLDTADSPVADLAAAGGFADQAHATREVRRITGTTPARLRAALQQDRDGDSSVRLAAAFVRGRFDSRPDKVSLRAR